MDNLVIFFPDEPTFTIKGRFVQFGPLGETWWALLEVTGVSLVAGYEVLPGVVLLVEPTAVIVNALTGTVVYNGREWYAQMPADKKRYFDEHPEWPGTLKLDMSRRQTTGRPGTN